MINFKKIFNHRFGPVAVVAVIICLLGFITRIILLVKSGPNLDVNPLSFIGIFLVGLFYDLVVASFFAIPIALYCWLMKDSWYQKKWSRILLFALFFIITLILVLNVGGEIIFWNEFSVRYNFIAVDYLIYTNEVFNNIIESYNMPLLLSGMFVAIAPIVLLFRKPLIASQQTSMRLKKRSLYFLGFLIFPLAAYFLVNNWYKNISKNNYVNELAGNGIYEFGSAFWNNEIEYEKFYATKPNTANIAIVRQMLQANNSTFIGDSLSVDRIIKCDSPVKKLNVVYISVESLSGDYLKHFGNTENITPYLDSLVPHSLFFENFYASGTRTVRGLEALSLAIPPTPGQSIVRRKDNGDMFTIGNVLKQKGYDVNFVYGGNSFFDNMGKFFGGNGYTVIDQGDIPKNMVHHTSAWGVDDEASFNYLLQQCDSSYKKGKLFFNHIMTVSNHRPYTFPDGRIDILSSAQIPQGGVKYTDYAIHKFIEDAKTKPWFNNTIFVIVADHCSKSAGKTDLPVNRYHIPCLIYAPTLIKPAIENRMVSQIDLAPTLLGLLNESYTSRFLGYDIYNKTAVNDRLFISTYQDMGYIRHDTMVVLSPRKKIMAYKIDFNTGVSKSIFPNNSLVNEAIAWYQGANYLYKQKKYLKL